MIHMIYIIFKDSLLQVIYRPLDSDTPHKTKAFLGDDACLNFLILQLSSWNIYDECNHADLKGPLHLRRIREDLLCIHYRHQFYISKSSLVLPPVSL